MRLLRLTPNVAAHLAVQARRSVAALEAAPNLPAPGRADLDDLKRVIADLDQIARDNSGQNGDTVCVVEDDENRKLLSIAEAASASNVSIKTLRRRLDDGALHGTNNTVAVNSLRQWMHDGKPTARQRRRTARPTP